mgnify:CR=1 FL=1
MKIILTAVNAKYIHSNLAVYTLQASAEKAGVFPEIREFTINQSKDSMLRSLFLARADVVCVSCYIWNISIVEDLITEYHKISPKTKIWLGGPEVSYHAEEMLEQYPFLAGIMKGEGEVTFREIAVYYQNQENGMEGKTLEEIHGITYRDADGAVKSNPWRPVMDLSEVDFPYANLKKFENRIIYYESSRGCPFSCSYCLSSIDKKLRFRDIELVKKELQFFIDNKVPQVKFVDRTFNCKHDHAMEIWRYITENDNGITNFHFEISADLLRAEELALMKTMRPGLIQLEIGVQSTNPQTIKAIRRTMDFEKLKGIVEQIHSFGNIHQHLDLIAGLPYEGYDSFHKSFCDVYALRPEQFQLGFLKVLKGSHMMEMTGEYQILYKDREPYEVLSTAWLTYGEILRLKMVESMVEVYYNSGQFKNTLVFLEKYFDDPFRMYEALGRFYEKKGYSEISHSRMRRYEILMEFAGEQKEIPSEALSDVMLLDLYLRENLKSRPSFASDQKPYERLIWDYRKAKKIPKTAHIEVFRDGKKLLFDYTDRDPLTNNAQLTDITDEVNDNYGNV